MTSTGKTKESIWPEDRVAGFTDGIFAFAITLLVLNLIDVTIPPGNQSLLPVLRDNASALITFIATFLIISRFWMSHTRLFAIIKQCDTAIIRLNNTLLFFITTFPFIASVLGTHIENKDAVIMYAACFAAIGILQYMIARHAYKAGLFVQEYHNEAFHKVYIFFSLSTPIVFIVSIIVAFFSPLFAEILWAALFFLRIGFKYYYRNDRSEEVDLERL